MISKKVWFFLLIFGLLFGLGLEKALAAPSAPQNFRASGLSSCAASLTWNQPDNADYFQLSLDNRTWTTLEGLSGSGEKSFNHAGLDPGSSFRYYLRSCANIGGCSNPAGPANATLSALTAAPAMPTALQTLRWEVNGERVVLSWTPSQAQQQRNASLTGFQVWRSDDNGDFNSQPIFSLQSFNNANGHWSDAVGAAASHRYKIKTYQTDQYCDTGDADQIRYSDIYSTVLTIPKKPAYLRESETRNNRGEARFEWENVDNETRFFLYVAQDANFISSSTYSLNANQNVSDWIEFSPNQTFYLRARACHNADNNSGCSDFANATYQSGLAGPTDLKIYVQSADFNANLGKVKLGWRDEAGAEHQTKIYRNGEPIATLNGQRVGNLIIPPGTEYEENDDLGQVYDYEVRFYYPREQRESAAGEQVARVNLNFVHSLVGWSWSDNFGWLKMDSETAPADGIPYGVYVDSDGLLWGYTWSDNAGWLSFNKVDLVGCPAELCEARVNLQTGQLNGWVRFVGADPTKGAWQGWLSLSELNRQQGFNDKVKNFFANLIGLLFRK